MDPQIFWRPQVPPQKNLHWRNFFQRLQSHLAIAQSDLPSYQHFLMLGTSWVPYIFLLLTWHVDCEPIPHICTRVENSREGVAQIFAWGVKAFQTIFPRGSPILGFMTFIFSKSFKNLPRGVLCYTTHSSLTPLCASM